MTLQELGGLKYNPFSLIQGTLASKFESEDLKQTQLRISRTAKEGGIFLLTGDPGKGISFAASCSTLKLESMGFTVKYMEVNHVSTRDFYKSLCQVTGTDPVGKSRGVLIDSFREKERQLRAQSRPLFLVLDDAQNIPGEALADLPRLVCNGHPPELLASIMLCGAKELLHRLQANPFIRPLVSDFYPMAGLSSEETSRYVLHKFRLAGCTETLLTDDAAKDLFSYSASGNYRLINNLMRDAIQIALNTGKKQIDREIIFSSAKHQF